MNAAELRTEYMVCPIGLDEPVPRFFWKNAGGLRQTAYRLRVFSEARTLWDSGKVLSPENTNITYGGEPLPEKTVIFWEVTLWDENGAEGERAETHFETGLGKTGFAAEWITGACRPEKNVRYPADCFRKRFSAEGTVRRARLYITAKGIYRAAINGHAVEDFVLAPGITDYRRRLQYQTYDVTGLLVSGHNEITVTLADGWYRGSVGCFGKTNVFGRETSVICRLELEYADGRRIAVPSDESWEWSNDGPVRFADLKDGEIVDAGKEPSYGGNAKRSREKNRFIITSSGNVPVKKQERFPGKVIGREGSAFLIDFGQNLAGFVSFELNGKAGQRLCLRLGETLDENGRFTQRNFQEEKPVREFGKLTELLLITGNRGMVRKKMQKTPLQQVIYTCREGANRYETAFSVFGFRYALVETELDAEQIRFEAVAVCSNLEKTGEFVTSDEDINRLYRNTVWSMKSNFLDIPTDCPTRERLGWTGDGQIFCNTASYLTLSAPFYEKWMRDFSDNQDSPGKLSAVVPYNGMSMIYDHTGTSAGWADAAVLIPYRIYRMFGDTRILENNYELMRRSVMYMISQCGRRKKNSGDSCAKYIYEKGVHLGEWLEPEEFLDMQNGAGAKVIRQGEVATAYLHHTLRIFREICGILKKEENTALLDEYISGTKKAYQETYLRDFDYSATRQAKLLRPIRFELADEACRKKLAEALAASVRKRNGRIGTGFLSTGFLLPVLAECGCSEEAYETLFNRECPGWLWELDRGATTVWEKWENDLQSSKNHYALGAVSEFLFSCTLGIRVTGRNRFTVEPCFTDRFSFVSGSYDSIYGKVCVRWQWEENRIRFCVDIPSNCTAEIRSGGKCETVGAGHYDYALQRS